MEIQPGTVVANRYRISRPLGRGGMGEVFAAENIRTGRPVAVKLLHADSKTKSSSILRFQAEARAAGSINSDHVTQVLDVEDDPQHGIVLVFELLEGESLIERLKRTGPLSFAELHPLIEQVWIGLADAHRAGIIHRDLKPSNVFLEQRPDGTTRVKILDFGVSKVPKEADSETLTELGQSLGTFSFMPPEQIGNAKTVDLRADIYACATLIYQSLTGQLPFAARNVVVLIEMKKKGEPRKLADATGGAFDPRLEAFVARALSREPGRRYQSAVDALAAWREIRPQNPADSRAANAVHPAAAPVRTPPADMPTRVEHNARAPLDSGSDDTAATIALPISRLRGAPSPGQPLDPRLAAYPLLAGLGSTTPMAFPANPPRESQPGSHPQVPASAAPAPGAYDQGYVRHTPPGYDPRLRPPSSSSAAGLATPSSSPAPAGFAPPTAPAPSAPLAHSPEASAQAPIAMAPATAAVPRKPGALAWIMGILAFALLGFAIVAVLYYLRLYSLRLR